MNRLKSKVVWISIASLVMLIFGELGLFQKMGITQDTFKIVIESILSLLVLFGVLNNPTDSENF